MVARKAESVATERLTEEPPGLLSVVIPAYDEEESITATLSQLRSGFAREFPARPLELLVVDDGSTDETPSLARKGGADRLIPLGRNRGKGAAVRTGVLAAAGEVIVYTDADLPFAPASLARLVRAVDDGAAAAVGVRRSNTASRMRRMGTRLINVLAGLLVHSRKHLDTQCGLKVFERSVAQGVFERCRVERFGFDAEVLLLLDRLGVQPVEVPVDVLPQVRKSRVSAVRDGLRTLRELIEIRSRARRGGYEMDAVSEPALEGNSSARTSKPLASVAEGKRRKA